MEREQIICHCRNITYGLLEDVIEAGYTSYQEIFNLLHFGVGCGGCKAKIRQLIYLMNVERKKKGL